MWVLAVVNWGALAPSIHAGQTGTAPSGQTILRDGTSFASPFYSGWWTGSTNVTQQWGCVIGPGEDTIIPAGHSCPSPAPPAGWQWHHGVDLAYNSAYPNGVGCNPPPDGPGTTIYAARAGTVSKIVSGQFQINVPAAGTNIYLNLVHDQQVFNDPSTGQPIAVGAHVNVGEAVVMTGNVPPAGGSSNGCHLHFEVDIGYTYLGSNGTNYDVDPTPWLFSRLDVITRDQSGQISQKYWSSPAVDQLSATQPAIAFQSWPSLLVSSYLSDPAVTWRSNQAGTPNSEFDMLVEGSDSHLWQWRYTTAGTWTDLGAYPSGTIGSDTPALAAPPTGDAIDAFLI